VTQPDLSALEGLSVEDKLELLELLELRDRRKRENWLQAYRPYAKQREFHETGAVARERLFMAGNQLGKTYSGAAEVAFHVTGLYPDWWTGYRFRRPTRWIVGSESAELTRKGIQRLLLGSPEKREEWGTGAIPKSHVKGWSMKPGVPDAVSSITVKNEYGGESVIQFNSYDQGRTKWQADTLDGVWMDEEPPIDVYSEALTRTNATGGLLFITFTPLLGMSLVVKRFLKEKPAGTAVISMTIDDVEHYTPEQRAAIIAGYPEHEREARARGIPMMGSGQVFPIAESAIRVEPFQIPPHWARINGIDFGIDHPAAFACLAHDRDTDTVYLYDGWRMKGKSAAEQAMVVMAKGQSKTPWAWPHDGLQRDKGAGQVLYKQYAGFGMNMLAERAQFEPTADGKAGGFSVEAGVSLMYERMQTRRLRVFSTVTDFFEEMRQYHRKDGVIVKEDDDLISATRYALMMLRRARTMNEIAEAEAKPGLLAGASMPAPSFGVLDELAGY
jgi:phage terminase large subunit-like protein